MLSKREAQSYCESLLFHHIYLSLLFTAYEQFSGANSSILVVNLSRSEWSPRSWLRNIYYFNGCQLFYVYLNDVRSIFYCILCLYF